MIARNSTLALILTVALTATAAVHAGEPAPDSPTPSSVTDSSVTISAHSEGLSCEGLSPDEARRIAQKAERAGAHPEAAECFRIAGDLPRAHRAQIRASADEGAASAEKIAAHAETAKAQVKSLREAFRKL